MSGRTRLSTQVTNHQISHSGDRDGAGDHQSGQKIIAEAAANPDLPAGACWRVRRRERLPLWMLSIIEFGRLPKLAAGGPRDMHSAHI